MGFPNEYSLPSTSKGTKRVPSRLQEGRVSIKEDAAQWVHVQYYIAGTKIDSGIYCREDELQGLINALEKAKQDLKAR